MADYTGVDNLEVMRLARNYNRHLCTIVSRHDPGSGNAIDLGAGLGTFSGCAMGGATRVTCVESDAQLRDSLRAAGHRVAAGIGDVPDASVDYAFSLNVLEHIADDGHALGELARVLRPGGRLLLYLPAFPMLFSSMDAKVGHHRRYTRASVSPMLKRSGFRILTTRYEDFLGFFATLVFKLADRRDSGDIDASALVVYDRWIFPLSRLLSRVLGRTVGKNLLVVAEKLRTDVPQPRVEGA